MTNIAHFYSITCTVCGWHLDVDLDAIESGKLKPAEPVSLIEKHLKEVHNAEPRIAMRKKSKMIN